MCGRCLPVIIVFRLVVFWLLRHYEQVPLISAQHADAIEELEDAESHLRNVRAATEAAQEQRIANEEARLRAESDLRRVRSATVEATKTLQDLKQEHEMIAKQVSTLSHRHRELSDQVG